MSFTQTNHSNEPFTKEMAHFSHINGENVVQKSMYYDYNIVFNWFLLNIVDCTFCLLAHRLIYMSVDVPRNEIYYKIGAFDCIIMASQLCVVVTMHEGTVFFFGIYDKHMTWLDIWFGHSYERHYYDVVNKGQWNSMIHSKRSKFCGPVHKKSGIYLCRQRKLRRLFGE